MFGWFSSWWTLPSKWAPTGHSTTPVVTIHVLRKFYIREFATYRDKYHFKIKSLAASLNCEAEAAATFCFHFFCFAFCCIRGTHRGERALCCSLGRLHRESLLPLAHNSINNYLVLKLNFGMQSVRTNINFILHEECQWVACGEFHCNKVIFRRS